MLLTTSSAAAVATYCDEHIFVCLSVCLSDIWYLRSHASDLHQMFVHVPTAVARSASGRVTKSQGEGAVLGLSSPLTMHCNALAVKEIIWYRPGMEWWQCTARAKCDLLLPCLVNVKSICGCKRATVQFITWAILFIIILFSYYITII